MYAEDVFGNEKPQQDKKLSRKIILVLFALIIIPALIYLAIAEIYFPHGDCKIDVAFGHVSEFWNLMDYVKKYDPSAYSMMCNNVNEVDFQPKLLNHSAAYFEWIKREGRDRPQTKITVSETFWNSYNRPPFALRANVLVHEVCHSIITNLRGNIHNIDGCDIEYPCYLRGALLMYKLGYYNKTQNPYNSMLGEKKQCGLNRDGSNDYCNRASIKLKEVSDGSVVFENNGTEKLHCMMLELLISGIHHPVDCDFISPGESTTIYNKYLDGTSNASLRIFGCNDRTDIGQFIK